MSWWLIWLLLGIAFLILEIVTFTFICLWIAAGALFAAVLAWFMPEALAVQIFAGSALTLVLTLATKPLTRRFFSKSEGFRDTPIIGQKGIVEDDFSAGQLGTVKLNGESWSARSTQHLKAQEKVTVTARSGTILIVQKLDESKSTGG